MKKILKFMAAVAGMVLLVNCGSGAGDIKVSFDVENPNFSMLALVYNNEVVEIHLDGSGRAEHVIPGLEAVYISVYSGTDMKTIYLEKGDRAVISFNGDDFPGTFKLSGDKVAAAQFLNTVIPAALPDDAYALPFGEFYAVTQGRISDIMTLMDAHDLKGEGKFLKMEQGRIKYAYYCTYLMYPMAHVMMAEDADYQPDEEYYSLIRGLFTADADLVDIQQYREFMCEAAHVLDEENCGVNDLYPKLVNEMKFIAREISDSAVCERLLHHIALPYIGHFGTDNVQEMCNIYRTYVSDEAMLEEFGAACDKWDRKKAGKVAADFKAVDIDGKEYSLADFRGKYLYIDIWATWCSPCKREIPHLQALEKKFKGREIVFLSLSVDKDKAAWEAMVKEGGLSGVQLYLGPESDFLKAFEVSGIPRFILLDKEGRILNANMSRPSSESTARNISELEGI